MKSSVSHHPKSMLKMKLPETHEGLISFLVPGTRQAHYISVLGYHKFLEDNGPTKVGPQPSVYNGPSSLTLSILGNLPVGMCTVSH